MKNIENLKYAITHGSIFHSDDVFATALLLRLNPDLQVERTNNLELAQSHLDDEDTIVYDIGLGEYDHHQDDDKKEYRMFEDGYYTRKDGRVSPIPYSSFGKLWRDFGAKLCPKESAWKKVDRDLVLPIDKADNGCFRSAFASIISVFNPNWNEDNTDARRYVRFMEAVAYAQTVLDKFVASANAVAEAAEKIGEHSEVIDGKILVLDQYLPWQDAVIETMPEILFVSFPSSRHPGRWNVQTVPKEAGSFDGRKLFPSEWLGLQEADNSPLGITFCHPGNFLLEAKDRDAAIRCARYAIS